MAYRDEPVNYEWMINRLCTYGLNGGVCGVPSELETREPYGKIVRGKNEMLDKIKNVIFNDPATIVFWDDGTKTVVKAEDEAFDPEKGLAMAIVKKTMANNHGYYNEIFKKWIPEKVKVESVTKVYSGGVQVGVFYRDFALKDR